MYKYLSTQKTYEYFRTLLNLLCKFFYTFLFIKESWESIMNLERHEKILDIMQQQNMISIRELAERLSCTEMTVRRNLDQLQAQNLVRREHGYAYLVQSSSNRITDYYTDLNQNIEEKKAIATIAVSLLTPGTSLCLDSGTTIQQVVEAIPQDMPLSVITPSLAAAMTLSSNDNIQIMMPGGFLHHHNRSLLIDNGDSLRKYRVNMAFMSCLSFQYPGGTFEHSQTMMNTKRILASIADKIVLLMDYSKWGVNSIFNCIPMEQINTIITDDKAPEDNVMRAVETGIEVIIVSTQTHTIVAHYHAKQALE